MLKTVLIDKKTKTCFDGSFQHNTKKWLQNKGIEPKLNFYWYQKEKFEYKNFSERFWEAKKKINNIFLWLWQWYDTKKMSLISKKIKLEL